MIPSLLGAGTERGTVRHDIDRREIRRGPGEEEELPAVGSPPGPERDRVPV
jgi:hypothetical protein